MRKPLYIFISLVLLVSFLVTACTPAARPTAEALQPSEITLATTTSTQDSGMLDVLIPMFEEEFNVKVKVIAVGSGQAMQMGEDGDADVLLVHSPAAEKEFMEGGHGVRREDVMYNDFLVAGPEADPAKIAGMETAAEGFKAIAAAQAPFVSRGDDSGTHAKEKSIWSAAEIEPAGEWYISAGQGMATVLTMADELQAYTLSDRATYLTSIQNGLGLKTLLEGDHKLFNPYGVIAINPEKNIMINNAMADQFIEWIISDKVQDTIGNFKKEDLGMSLFIPNYKP
jgi:tungstate transport system substrate-binding protein